MLSPGSTKAFAFVALAGLFSACQANDGEVAFTDAAVAPSATGAAPGAVPPPPLGGLAGPGGPAVAAPNAPDAGVMAGPRDAGAPDGPTRRRKGVKAETKPDALASDADHPGAAVAGTLVGAPFSVEASIAGQNVSWTGSRLTFTSESLQGHLLSVVGHFAWVRNGVSVGTVPVSGSYNHATGRVSLLGRNGSMTTTYEATYVPTHNQFTGGTWTGATPGTWTASR